jgi:class 3 adenylate cyclase
MTAIAACRTCGTEPLENARFCHGCGSPVDEADTRAEFKQVTALFADVVHSMDIAATVGPERLREIMAELADRCATVVQRYGGTVDKFTGDGIMAGDQRLVPMVVCGSQARRVASSLWPRLPQRSGLPRDRRHRPRSGDNRCIARRSLPAAGHRLRAHRRCRTFDHLSLFTRRRPVSGCAETASRRDRYRRRARTSVTCPCHLRR